jgi:ubiquinone/menaquinone biosynthesis C-methylase UbiE
MSITSQSKALVGRFINFLKFIISRIFALIYDTLVSYPVTIAIYKYLLKSKFQQAFPNCKPTSKGKGVSMIDIGTASGTCLKKIISLGNFERVLAIDIDKEYVKSATKLFEKNPNVEVKLQDFQTYLEEGNTERFDIVFFGFSFMLMPDKAKALEVARRIVKPGGKIYAFLTLYEKKNKFIEWVKPKIVKFTSIKFGPVMYRK